MIKTLPLLLLMCVAVFAALGLFNHKSDKEKRSPLIGTTLPAFDLPVLGQSSARLTPESFKNKVVVLNFFASWCMPCAKEHPLFTALAADTSITLYGIAWRDTSAKIAPWLAARGNPFAQIGVDESGQTTVAFGLSGVPETFIIDKRGMIVFHYKSAISEAVIEEQIKPLLERLAHE